MKPDNSDPTALEPLERIYGIFKLPLGRRAQLAIRVAASVTEARAHLPAAAGERVAELMDLVELNLGSARVARLCCSD